MKIPFTRFSILTALMLAVSCVLWTGCEEELTELETEKPDDSQGPDDGEGETPDTPLEPEGDPYFAVELIEVGPNYADVSVTAKKILKAAYLISTERKTNVRSSYVFKSGTEITLPENPMDTVSVQKVSGNMDEKSTYYVYFAAQKDASAYWPDVYELEVNTVEFKFDQLLTVMDTYYDGCKIKITVPEEVKAKGHAIRYSISSIPMYHAMKNWNNLDFDMLLTNGGAYSYYTLADTVMVYNNSNIEDPEDPNFLYHYPIMPGEPIIYFAGEYAWDDTTNIYGWGEGYFGYQYDLEGYLTGATPPENNNGEQPYARDEDAYWYGAFQRLVFDSKAPMPLDADFDIEVVDISPIQAIMDIVPQEGIERYAYCVLDHGTYQTIIDEYLMGEEKYLQWFITSYFARMELSIAEATGPETVIATEFFVDPALNSETLYHLLLVGTAGEYLERQCFKDFTFETTAKVLDAPEITVTPVPSDDPFLATFNIKATKGQVVSGRWACDYERNWKTDIAKGSTYSDIVDLAYSFSTSEINLINSASGLNIDFESVDGETTMLAVKCYNSEYTPNTLEKGDPSIASYTTPIEPYIVQIKSDLFDALPGEWTATAKVWYRESDADGQIVEHEINHSSKITIAREIEVPALTQDVIDLYKSEAEAQAYYDQFTTLAKGFSERRMLYRNRLLCMGWIDYDTSGKMDTYSPWDLFTDSNYQSFNVAQLFYDFGPKWYLDVAADGTVTVPINASTLAPMANWMDYPYYLVAYDRITNDGYMNVPAGFPVEISDDMQTITVKPIWMIFSSDGMSYSIVEPGTEGATPYYPNAVGINNGSTELIGTVVSEIVMKKNAAADVSAAPASKARAVRPQVMNPDGSPVALEDVRNYKDMSDLKSFEKVDKKEYPRREIKVITTEKVEAAFRDYAEKLFNK